MFEDMVLWFGHKMSPPEAHVFEAGAKADGTILEDPGNFAR